MNFVALDISILGPAFCAGLLVLATHVVLGREVLRRGIIFIDLAVAQIAGLGVIAAAFLHLDTHGVGVQIAAALAAILGALLLTNLEKRHADIQEALIGVLFVLAATAALLLLSRNPHGAEQLKDLLVGQILWVGWSTLAWVALVTAAVLAAWFTFKPRGAGFYLLFAISVTASVQLVGIYLVFASLIIPALATRKLSGRSAVLAAYGLGAAAYAAGLAGSALWDLPSGALIVWSLAVLGIMMAWLLAWGIKKRAHLSGKPVRETDPAGADLSAGG